MAELTNPQNTPEPDGATLTIESDSDQGTLYSYSKTTPFNGTPAEKAAEIMANGVGQSPVIGTNTRVVIGQDGMTDHYAGWVQDSDGYGSDLAMEFDVSSKSLTIQIGAGTYDAVVDWGDGETSTVTGVDPAGPTHTYAAEAADTAVVRISGVFPYLYWNNAVDLPKLKKTLNIGDVGWENIGSTLNGSADMTELHFGVTDLSAVENFGYFTYIAAGIQAVTGSENISTISATTMKRMWGGLTSLTTVPWCGNYSMGLVTNVERMFFNWSSAGAVDVGTDQWDVSAITVFTDFMSGSQLTTAAYDRTLASWGNQTLAAGAASATIHFGNSTYTDTANRALLLAQVAGIIDGGVAP